MPKIARELTALGVARMRVDGEYVAGGVPGLYFWVEGPSRSWVLRFAAEQRPQRNQGRQPSTLRNRRWRRPKAVSSACAGGGDGRSSGGVIK